MPRSCSCPLHGDRQGFFNFSRTMAEMECPFCATPLCAWCFEHCPHECGPSEPVHEIEAWVGTEKREPVPA